MLVRELTRAECKDLLSRASIGRLACVQDDQPYVVPISLAFDGTDLYSFSTAGQKIQWMRANPRVEVEVDEIVDPLQWITVVVFGRYEEITRSAEHKAARAHAEEVLARRPTFWLPGSARTPVREPISPVIYRIAIASMTGRRAGGE
jgi:hypothetical protein